MFVCSNKQTKIRWETSGGSCPCRCCGSSLSLLIAMLPFVWHIWLFSIFYLIVLLLKWIHCGKKDTHTQFGVRFTPPAFKHKCRIPTDKLDESVFIQCRFKRLTNKGMLFVHCMLIGLNSWSLYIKIMVWKEICFIIEHKMGLFLVYITSHNLLSSTFYFVSTYFIRIFISLYYDRDYYYYSPLKLFFLVPSLENTGFAFLVPVLFILYNEIVCLIMENMYMYGWNKSIKN